MILVGYLHGLFLSHEGIDSTYFGSVNFCQTTRRHIPEESTLHSHCRHNLRTNMDVKWSNIFSMCTEMSKISVTSVENSAASLIIHFTRFYTVTFPCFLPCALPVLHIIERHAKVDV
jgi:hypothetical protein